MHLSLLGETPRKWITLQQLDGVSSCANSLLWEAPHSNCLVSLGNAWNWYSLLAPQVKSLKAIRDNFTLNRINLSSVKVFLIAWLVGHNVYSMLKLLARGKRFRQWPANAQNATSSLEFQVRRDNAFLKNNAVPLKLVLRGALTLTQEFLGGLD